MDSQIEILSAISNLVHFFSNPRGNLFPRPTFQIPSERFQEMTFAEYSKWRRKKPPITLRRLIDTGITIGEAFANWEDRFRHPLLKDLEIRDCDFMAVLFPTFQNYCEICGKERFDRGNYGFGTNFMMYRARYFCFDERCDSIRKRKEVISAFIQDYLDSIPKSDGLAIQVSSYKDVDIVDQIDDGRYSCDFMYMKTVLFRFAPFIKFSFVEDDCGNPRFHFKWARSDFKVVQNYSPMSLMREYQFDFLTNALSERLNTDLGMSLAFKDELREIIVDLPLSLISFSVWQTERSYLQYRKQGLRGKELLSYTKGALRKYLTNNAIREDIDPSRYANYFELDDSFYVSIKRCLASARLSVVDLKTKKPEDIMTLI